MSRRTQELLVVVVIGGMYLAWWIWAGGLLPVWDWVAGWWPW